MVITRREQQLNGVSVVDHICDTAVEAAELANLLGGSTLPTGTRPYNKKVKRTPEQMRSKMTILSTDEVNAKLEEARPGKPKLSEFAKSFEYAPADGDNPARNAALVLIGSSIPSSAFVPKDPRKTVLKLFNVVYTAVEAELHGCRMFTKREGTRSLVLTPGGEKAFKKLCSRKGLGQAIYDTVEYILACQPKRKLVEA